MESFCSLKQKEIINIRDGYRFGFLNDIEIDIKTAKIIALTVYDSSSGLFGIFGKEKEFRIPWNCICRIGEDVILVDVCVEDMLCDKRRKY